MKYLIFIFFVIYLNATNLTDFINKKNCDQIIDKKVFKICYDFKMKGALFVGYELQGDLVNKKNIKKRPSFYTEKTLKKEYRSHTRDYISTGWDRGHLANDGSFDYDKKILRKTYTMANIIPQASKINRYTWIKAEKLERVIAFKFGSVNVMNGVLYKDIPKRIGKNEIAVPSAFWKMIYNDKKNYKKCFFYKNDKSINTKNDKLKNHLVDCEKL